MTKTEARKELRKLLDGFPGSSRSQQVRVELSDTIAAVYCAGHIDREEYQEMMAYVR